jgi:hypothetical protein
MSRELDPIDVLADLLGEEGFEIAPEADLVRDIALEPTKARAKLDRVKKALLIARARTLHLEAVELKLAAAIEAATPLAA